ncbi:unnamed protein product, partial [Discosporangium mesarthrocarpum]
GNEEATRALLAAGAPVGKTGPWQSTPLHVASYFNHIEAVRMLIGAGADPEALNSRGET